MSEYKKLTLAEMEEGKTYQDEYANTYIKRGKFAYRVKDKDRYPISGDVIFKIKEV